MANWKNGKSCFFWSRWGSDVDFVWSEFYPWGLWTDCVRLVYTVGSKYLVEEEWFDHWIQKISLKHHLKPCLISVISWITCVRYSPVRVQSFNFEIFLVEADRKQVEDAFFIHFFGTWIEKMVCLWVWGGFANNTINHFTKLRISSVNHILKHILKRIT